MNNLFYTYFLIGIIIFSFVLNPFSKKKASKNLTSQEYFMVNQFMVTILVIVLGIYFFYNNKCDFKCLQKMSNKEVSWAILSSILGIMGSLAFITLIQQEDISFIMPNIQPLVILLVSIIGFFLFKESMGIFKIIGIILIICGSFFINYDKIKNNT